MRNNLYAAILAAPLALAACQPGVPPVITPVPIPSIVMPPEVQQACQVLSWAVPAASVFINLSLQVAQLVAAAGPALASCAAGNANAAIVDLAVALQQYLVSRGVRAPVGVPVLRR